MPNAKVTLKNDQTGASQTVTSNGTGAYRFALLNPGTYTITATSQGLQASPHQTEVAVGQASMVNIQMQVTAASTTVEVSGVGGVIQTENGNVSASAADSS